MHRMMLIFLRSLFESRLLLMTFVAATLTASPSLSHGQDNDPACLDKAWGPYAPKPGHPTPTEKQTFLDQVIPLAVAAEKKFGVPAAALAAMSTVESGFGWTRAALNGNVLLAFKYNPSLDKGRDFFTLPCQPANDEENRYLKFNNYAEAFDIVALKLSTLRYYAAATSTYREANPKTKEAVIAWLTYVARYYNANPAAYIETVIARMNDPLHDGVTIKPDNLYKLSIPSYEAK